MTVTNKQSAFNSFFTLTGHEVTTVIAIALTAMAILFTPKSGAPAPWHVPCEWNDTEVPQRICP